MTITNNLSNYFQKKKGQSGMKKRQQGNKEPPEDKKSRFNGTTPPKDNANLPPEEDDQTSITSQDAGKQAEEEDNGESMSLLPKDRETNSKSVTEDCSTLRSSVTQGDDIINQDTTENTEPKSTDTSVSMEESDKTHYGPEKGGKDHIPPTQEKTPIEGNHPKEKATEQQKKGPSKDASHNQTQDWVYVTRRMIVSLDIAEPTDGQDRVELLCKSLNSFLELARKFSGKHLRVMQYGSLEVAHEENRKQWLKKFKACSVELKEFTHGYYPFQKLRAGTYRLKLKLAVPLKRSKTITDFIETCSEYWGNIMFPTVRDLPSQFIYNPKKLGWFLRSTRFASHTADLQEELDSKASAFYPELHFSLSYQTVPDPNNGVYDPETATKAICIETNEQTFHEAWDFLQRTYNLKTTEYPLGVKMNFVGSKDHPDYKNDYTAKQNISILMKRQKIFEENMSSVSTHVLIDIDYPYDGTRSLRHRLMELSPKTMGPLFSTARLFHSIDRSISRTGTQSYHFTFHASVLKEASNIVSGITEMLRDELNLEPESYCFAHCIKDGYTWDPETKQSSNPSVDVLKFVLDLSEDLQVTQCLDGVEEEDEEFELSSKAERERDRVMGLDDSETVEDLKQRKQRKPKSSNDLPTSSVTVQQDEVSEVTQYSNSTKASHERKKLRGDLDEKNKRIAELEAQLASNKLTTSDDEPSSSESSSQRTGEDSGESERDSDNDNSDNQVIVIDPDKEQENNINNTHTEVGDDESTRTSGDERSLSASEEDESPSTGVRFRESKNEVKYIPRTPSKKQQPSPFFSSSDESDSSPEATSNNPIARKLYPGKTPPKASKWKKPSKISTSMLQKAKEQMRKPEAIRGHPEKSD